MSTKDSNLVVSKVGQSLVEHVMTEVVREFDRGDLSEDEFVERVLHMSYAAIALALGWMDTAILVDGYPEWVRKQAFNRANRIGRALALDRFEGATARPELQPLIEDLQPELKALDQAKQAVEAEKKGRPN